MNKLFKMFAGALLAVTSTFAIAELTPVQEVGVGTIIWYAGNCEPMNDEVETLFFEWMASEGLTEDTLVYNKNVLLGWTAAVDLGCLNIRQAMIEDEPELYELMFDNN